MKRVLCPKCENYLYFDETKYSEGQSLVFECEHCGKQFSIRLGKSKVKALRKEENLEEEAEVHKEEFGYITVIENIFGFKQILPLQEGDNVIGRRCVGTVINTPIESGDMKMSGIMICVTGVVVIVAASLAAGSVLYLLQRKKEKLKSEQINL